MSWFPFAFLSSKVTVVPICHAIIDTTVNLSQEKTGKNLSWLIYESSLTIDASTKSNVKGSLVTFVRAVQWKQCACGFPVKEKLAWAFFFYSFVSSPNTITVYTREMCIIYLLYKIHNINNKKKTCCTKTKKIMLYIQTWCKVDANSTHKN